jgi:uncharacterized membrane protein
VVIGFVLPALKVFEDRKVTGEELAWYAQQLTDTVMGAMLIAFTLVVFDEVVEWQ